jgi:hypothetical protein
MQPTQTIHARPCSVTDAENLSLNLCFISISNDGYLKPNQKIPAITREYEENATRNEQNNKNHLLPTPEMKNWHSKRVLRSTRNPQPVRRVQNQRRLCGTPFTNLWEHSYSHAHPTSPACFPVF